VAEVITGGCLLTATVTVTVTVVVTVTVTLIAALTLTLNLTLKAPSKRFKAYLKACSTGISGIPDTTEEPAAFIKEMAAIDQSGNSGNPGISDALISDDPDELHQEAAEVYYLLSSIYGDGEELTREQLITSYRGKGLLHVDHESFFDAIANTSDEGVIDLGAWVASAQEEGDGVARAALRAMSAACGSGA